MALPRGKSILLADSTDSQPELPEENPRLRSLRNRRPRPSALSTSLEPGSSPRPRARPSSTQPDPHGNVSTSRSSTMPRSRTNGQQALAPRLTKTGRVSKARKGLRNAHICDRCGKSYSRNEHLRRHQQNHEPAKLQCGWPRCGRAFARQDLLERHELKHTETDDQRRLSSDSGSPSSPIGLSSRRTSRPPSRAESGRAVLSDSFAQPIPHFPPRPRALERPSTPPRSQILSVDSSKLQTSLPTPVSHVFSLEVLPEPTHGLAPEADGFNSLFSNSLPFGSFPANDYSFSGFGDIPLEQWPIFPSTSISPISATPQIPYIEPPEASHFPVSVASSPRSQHATFPLMKMVPQVTGSVPYPLPWAGHHDECGSLSLEGLLEEQQLGRYLSLDKKQHFVDAYWKHFHSLFPILHRQTYQRHRSNPLFSAAVMAVGAQFSDRGFAKSDSRILHEKCQELIAKYKEDLKKTNRLDYMQAVFLTEVLSHFTAKRAPNGLSEVFLAMYDQLWLRHNNIHPESIGKTQLDSYGTVAKNASEQTIHSQWRNWIHAHSFERLLAASHILESQQALLLIRPNASPKTSDAGLELYMPVPAALWDLNSAAAWSQTLALRGPLETTAVFHILGDIQSSSRDLHFDDFQSLLLLSCHTNSTLSQSLEISPYLTRSHPIFDPQSRPSFERVLSQTPYVQIQYQVVLLASYGTPFKALLAASGESWVLSQRLSSVSREAKENFEALQTDLRLWVNGVQPSYQNLFSGPETHQISPSVFAPSESRAAHALRCALRIIALSLDTSASFPIFGPEMSLYYAALVLWATTYIAVSCAENAGIDFEKSESADIEPAQAESLIRAFVEQAAKDVDSAPVGAGIPSLAATASWSRGTGAVLRWTAWILSGAHRADQPTAGVGELMDSAKGVLDKLCRRGWSTGWF